MVKGLRRSDEAFGGQFSYAYNEPLSKQQVNLSSNRTE
jgi:hypothetical protein